MERVYQKMCEVFALQSAVSPVRTHTDTLGVIHRAQKG